VLPGAPPCQILASREKKRRPTKKPKTKSRPARKIKKVDERRTYKRKKR
jgi:hypothetical protein